MRDRTSGGSAESGFDGTGQSADGGETFCRGCGELVDADVSTCPDCGTVQDPESADGASDNESAGDSSPTTRRGSDSDSGGDRTAVVPESEGRTDRARNGETASDSSAPQDAPGRVESRRRQPDVDEEFCTNCGTIVSKTASTCYQCKTTRSTGGKNPILAGVLSAILIGAGQVYNGKILKGVGFFVGSFFALVFSATVGLAPFAIVAVWIWGIYDAYTDAKGR